VADRSHEDCVARSPPTGVHEAPIGITHQTPNLVPLAQDHLRWVMPDQQWANSVTGDNVRL
jgi:hypothetical protein